MGADLEALIGCPRVLGGRLACHPAGWCRAVVEVDPCPIDVKAGDGLARRRGTFGGIAASPDERSTRWSEPACLDDDRSASRACLATADVAVEVPVPVLGDVDFP